MPHMNRNTRKYTRKGDIMNPPNGDAPDKANEQSYSIETKGEPGQVGDTKVPYYQLNPNVLNRAEHAVNSENVPPAERQRVKQYFNALNPNAE